MILPMDLTERKCTPCRGEDPPLSPDQARLMLAELPGWAFLNENTRISRGYRLKNFRAALAFVNRVGEVAEAEGHHPDIRLFSWNKVEFTLFTHKIGGLHENDFILAAKIDALAAEAGIN